MDRSRDQAHATAFFVNTLSILFAIVWRPGRSAGRFDAWALPVAAGMLVLGGLIEVLQGGVVGRDSQFTDWLADGIGITLAVMVFASLRWALRGAIGAALDRGRDESRVNGSLYGTFAQPDGSGRLTVARAGSASMGSLVGR